MDETNVAIQVHGLQKSYKKLQVLKGVYFDVARGSIFALLGSNGAGKTTIVRILTTLLKPDQGTTRVNGFDVLSQPAQVRESISLTGQFAAVDGTLDRADAWGMRKMAYEIKQRNEADYRFYRFQGEPDLLERLDHSLKIIDGVLHFRIFKVDPEAPANPPPEFERLLPSGGDRGDRERRPRRSDRDE